MLDSLLDNSMNTEDVSCCVTDMEIPAFNSVLYEQLIYTIVANFACR